MFFCDSSYNTDAQCAQGFFSFSPFFSPRSKSFHQFFCIAVTIIIFVPSSSCCTCVYRSYTQKGPLKGKRLRGVESGTPVRRRRKKSKSPLFLEPTESSPSFSSCTASMSYCPVCAHTNRCKIFLRSNFVHVKHYLGCALKHMHVFEQFTFKK